VDITTDNRPQLIESAEVWMKRRGVPHFLDPRANEHRVLHVAYSFTFAIIFALVAYDKEGLNRDEELAVTVGVVAVIIVGSVVLRRHETDISYRVTRPGRMNLTVAAAIAIASIVDAIFAHDIRLDRALILAAAMIVLLAFAAATPLGSIRILWWACGHPFRELRQNVKVIAGALPLLLLTLAFLLLTTEIWQVATNLNGTELAATLGLFVGLGLMFLVVLAWARVTEAADFEDWEKVREALGRTEVHTKDEIGALDGLLRSMKVPDRKLARVFGSQRDTERRLEELRACEQLRDAEHRQKLGDIHKCCKLTARERWNITLVLVFGQAVQVLAVTLVMAAFFLLFGWLTVDEATLGAWLNPEHKASWEPEDGWWLWTGQHLKVTALLAAFAGLSYAVYAALFKEQRDLFFCELDRKATQRLAVRALHRGLQA